MEIFEASPKKGGNSLGITIPREIARKENLSTKKKVKILVLGNKMQELKKAFGSIKLNKPIQKIMEEIDEGYD